MGSTARRPVQPVRKTSKSVSDPFDRDVQGLPQASATSIVKLENGATYHLQAAAVVKQLGEQGVKMLAYNGSIPGPTLRVQQGSEVTIQFTNLTEVETTVHWHGLRLEHRYDGVPQDEHGGMQKPVLTSGSCTYRLRFPDPGVYWYHPHVREDYTQEQGLYGNIVVVPTDTSFWPPVNREITLVVDDILIENGMIAPFSRSGPTQVEMGRFGNLMLVNGETNFNLPVRQGEVVRLYLTNTANVRDFNLGFPGAKLKLVGGDNGRVEREQFVETIAITPSERVIVDALWEQSGNFPIEHHTMTKKTLQLGTITVSAEAALPTYRSDFFNLRRDSGLEALRNEITADLERASDKTLFLVSERAGMQHMAELTPEHSTEPMHHSMAHSGDLSWKIVDPATGKANHDIDWTFECGKRIKIRIENPSESELPMPHPMHFHGQRFLVLRRNGEINDNLVWKDTVYVGMGDSVEILLDTSNPGIWMAHCHIAEHAEGGMMFNFKVNE